MRSPVRSVSFVLVVALLVGGRVERVRAAESAIPPVTGAGVERSVVKVFSTVRRPDPLKPWNKQAPDEQSGSGVIIEGHRILTNAHVVLYASQVQIQAFQAGDKISATVEAIAPGIDLAVLKLDDDKLFATHPALGRAPGLPDVKDAVMAYGYPAGGSNLSITKGIVSRIEFTSYNFPVRGLRVQIDAAINPGNSGGPAVVGDKMIGLAFSTLGGAQNIGYIIPNEEIDLFLKDIADGKYVGKPALFDELQTLENPALRSFLKVPPEIQGIVVQAPFARMGGSPLKTWDVITRIAHHQLAGHHVADLRGVGIESRGHDARHEVALGEDADELPGVEDGDGADVPLAHLAGDVAHVVGGIGEDQRMAFDQLSDLLHFSSCATCCVFLRATFPSPSYAAYL